MYADEASIFISNNSYEELNRILNDVLCNTIKGCQVSQLVLNIERTKRVKFVPADPSDFSLQITSGEKLPVITNIINF
jgi:hypothetical protein